MQPFYTKLSCQKPMLRQTEWGVEKEPITKSGVLRLTTFLLKFNLIKEPLRNCSLNSLITHMSIYIPFVSSTSLVFPFFLSFN